MKITPLPVVAALCVASPLLAAGTPSDDSAARLAALEAEVAALRADRDAPLDAERSEELRRLVGEMVADADARASLLQSGMTAGYDNGFMIGSTDGNFSLTLNGLAQVRYIFNQQSNSPTDDDRGGFENTRTRLTFSGHVVDPSWLYVIQGNFDGTESGTFELQDAYIAKAFDNGLIFAAGQLRVPMTREFLVDEGRQLAVERSLMDAEFGARRTQGVALIHAGETIKLTGAFTDGHPGPNGSESMNTPWVTEDTEWSLTGRIEGLLAGTWAQFDQFTSPRGNETGFLLGGAVHWQQSESGTATDEIQVLQWTLDASAQFDGWNLYAAVVGRHLSEAVDLDQYGFVIQGGFYLTDDWELYARYEWGDDDDYSGGDDLSIITAGFNRYFAGQTLKWTSDFGYALNEVTATWGDGFLGVGGRYSGWRTDAPGEDGQWVLRTQLQLMF